MGVNLAGCVISMPGAAEQSFHVDGEADGLVNAFVPLVPLTTDNGPTQFSPSSHGKSRKEALADVHRPGHHKLISPLLSSGELLLFDYRVLHRGLANRGTHPRPVAYVVYGKPGVIDTYNFPSDRS